MKFGVHLKSVQLPVWRYYYIDYDSLKKKIKSMSKEGKDCPIEVESEFVEYLTRELNKVASFQFVKSGELHRRAEHCEAIITNIYANVKSMDPIRLDRVEEEIQRITLETNHLSRFTRLNYTGFLKILKKHDKHTSFELKPMFIAELNARPFFRENFDEIILKLSLLYDTIRNHGLPRSKGDYDESAAHSFVRKTTSTYLSFSFPYFGFYISFSRTFWYSFFFFFHNFFSFLFIFLDLACFLRFFCLLFFRTISMKFDFRLVSFVFLIAGFVFSEFFIFIF
ncbi:vacuolar transporter chaperone [Coelomomyces lativittatus]|nr:vacuolar transporter chaperone [Coelomomyces lativittatus]